MIDPVDRIKLSAYFTECANGLDRAIEFSTGPKNAMNNPMPNEGEKLDDYTKRIQAYWRIVGRMQQLTDMAGWVLKQEFVDTLSAIQLKE